MKAKQILDEVAISHGWANWSSLIKMESMPNILNSTIQAMTLFSTQQNAELVDKNQDLNMELSGAYAAMDANNKITESLRAEVERLNRFNQVQQDELVQRIAFYKAELERLKAERKKELIDAVISQQTSDMRTAIKYANKWYEHTYPEGKEKKG